MAIQINRILDEVRLLGCSDLHFTTGIAPVVRLNGTLRTMRSQYPEMDEEEILSIVNQMTTEAQARSVAAHKDTDFIHNKKWLPSPCKYLLSAWLYCYRNTFAPKRYSNT